MTIHENPYPGPGGVDLRGLSAIRRNLVNVFCQLSKVTERRKVHREIETVQIRFSFEDPSNGEPPVTDADAPSLLLYYLFDDWYMTYSLVARSEHQYGVQLDKIVSLSVRNLIRINTNTMKRDEMFESARIDHVHHLHHFGRQLYVLRRLYESYNLMIERLVSGPQQTASRKLPSFELNGSPQRSRVASFSDFMPEEKSYGVPISTAAGVRFERLKDRISLYALSEIKACLAEKDALMTLVWFNDRYHLCPTDHSLEL